MDRPVPRLDNPDRSGKDGATSKTLRVIVRFTKWLSPRSMLTLALLDSYVRHLTDDLGRASSTVLGYRSEIRLLIERAIPIEPEPMAAFITRAADGRLLAPTTRNRRLAILRGFFAFLIANGHLATDPTASVRRASVPWHTRTTLAPTEIGDVAKQLLLEPASAIRTRDLCILLVLFYTGLRVSEIVSLDLEQVDLEHGLLRGATRKGGGRTDVVLHARASEAIVAWLAVRPQGDSVAVFPTGNTGRLTVRSVQHRLARMGIAAELVVRLHPHELRHAHATALLRSGAAVEVIRQSLNHRSLQTTQRYLHGDLTMVRAAVDRLPDVQPTGEKKNLRTRKKDADRG